MAMKKVIVVNPDSSYAEVSVAQDESVALLRRVTKFLEPLGTVDSSNRQRITVEVMPSLTVSSCTLAANQDIRTVTTVTTVTSMTQFSGVDTKWFLVDTARNAYANGIRANISF